MIHSQKKRQSRETNSEMIPAFEISRQDIKAAIVTMLWDIKGNIIVMNENIRNLNKGTVTIKKKQMKIPKQKYLICEKKIHSWDLAAAVHGNDKIVNLITDSEKWSNLNNTEKKKD